MIFRKRATQLLAAASGLALIAGLSGCAQASSEDTHTLRVWWYDPQTQPAYAGLTAAIKQFKTEHPGVKVELEQKTFDQILKSGSQFLDSSSAPDVLEYAKGPASLGVAVKAGLLSDLTDDASAQGWTKHLSAGDLAIGRVDPRTGLNAAKAPLFAIPTGGEFVRVYYNKDLLDKQALDVPTTFSGLEDAMKKFSSAGITPLSLGGGDYPIVHLIYELGLQKADAKWVADYQGLKRKIDFQSDPVLKYGVDTVEKWLQAGFIAKSASGLKSTDMVNEFVNGDSPFMISGTWYTDQINQQAKFKWGSMLVPGSSVHEGDPTAFLVIPKKAKNKQLGEDLISAAVSQVPQNIVANAGAVAVAPDLSKVTSEVGLASNKQYQALSAANGFAGYPDWPAAGYYDTLLAAGEDLLNGNATPSAYLQQVGTAYNAAVDAVKAG